MPSTGPIHLSDESAVKDLLANMVFSLWDIVTNHALDADADAWTRMAIINVACFGKFSSDRTIEGCASGIWGALPCPVPAGAVLNNGAQA